MKSKTKSRHQHLRCEPLENRRLLAVVTSAADSGPGSLRDALTTGDPQITFDTVAMGGTTIHLTSGELVVDRSVVIDGGTGVTIDAGGSSRGMLVDDGMTTYANVELKKLTITGGNGVGAGSVEGGAIQSFENLTVRSVTLTENHVAGENADGGAIGQGNEARFAGDLAVLDSSIHNNSAGDDAAAIDFYNSRNLIIQDSAISGNVSGMESTRGAVGAVRVFDSLSAPPTATTDVQISNSTFNANHVQTDASGFASAFLAVNRVNFNSMSVMIEDSVISSNLTQPATNSPDTSGALEVDNIDSFQLSRSVVSDNRADLDGDGGGLTIDAVDLVRIVETRFERNVAGELGGAIRSNSRMEIVDSVFQANEAGAFGGAVWDSSYNVLLYPYGTSFTGSTISGNAAAVGGGVSANALEIIDSSINGNSATYSGGGLEIYGRLRISNSTISGNTAGSTGGGLYRLSRFEPLRVENSTITENSANSGGGLHVYGNSYSNYLTISDSVISGNLAASNPDVGFYDSYYDHIVVAVSYSLIGDGTGWNLIESQTPDAAGNLIGGPVGGAIDAELAPLADNGGPTLSHMPMPGSPVIDAGDPMSMAGVAGVPTTDQRGDGFGRVFGGRLDMGAIEFRTPPSIDGDFDDDGNYDCDDIDALAVAIAGSANDAVFDLTGDGLVDLDDRDAWLVEAGAANLPNGNPYLLGDANLDGFVDITDLNIWSSNKFSSTAAWCSADFNADGVVDVTDLNIWSSNKFQASVFLPDADGGTEVPDVRTGLPDVGSVRRKFDPSGISDRVADKVNEDAEIELIDRVFASN